LERPVTHLDFRRYLVSRLEELDARRVVILRHLKELDEPAVVPASSPTMRELEEKIKREAREDDTLDGAIVRLLSEAAGSMKSEDIARRIGRPLKATRVALARLRHRGKVQSAGKTKATVWCIATSAPLLRPTAPKRVPENEPGALVHKRDKAILERLRESVCTSADVEKVIDDCPEGKFVAVAHALRRLELQKRALKIGQDRWAAAGVQYAANGRALRVGQQ
jgi:hypothetical protein